MINFSQKNKLYSTWGGGLAWIISITLLLTGWEIGAGFFPVAILPSFSETLDALGWLLQRDSFYLHLKLTASRGGIGFLIAISFGSAVGLLMGKFFLAKWLINPLIVISTTVPPVFWVAVMIVWFGMGNLTPVLVIIITAAPLAAVNVSEGISGISPELKEMSHIFQVSPWTRLWELYLPAISGYLFSAALVTMRIAWRTVVMAEFIGSTAGLGNRLAWARQNLETDLAFAYMLVILFLGMSVEYLILRPLQKRWS